MSNRISHNISAALGLRLPFHAGEGITYDASAPDKYRNHPVALSDNGTVIPAAADTDPIGGIVVVEPADSLSTKVTVELGPVVRFKLAEGTDPAAGDYGKGVTSAGDGEVKIAATGGFGKITQFDARTRMVYVLTYGGAAAAGV